MDSGDHYRCRVCRSRRAADGAKTCDPCGEAVAKMLAPDDVGDPNVGQHPSIPVLFERLDPTPAVVEHERRGVGGLHRSPADEHVIAMRDGRSKCSPVVDVWYGSNEHGIIDWHKPHHEDECPPRPVPSSLLALARSIHEDRGFSRDLPTDLYDLCRWLMAQLDWLSRQERIGDDARFLRELQQDLLAATGDPPPRPVAWCIRVDVELDAECGRPIFLPPGHSDLPLDTPVHELPALRCGACGYEYIGIEVVRLRLANARDDAA